MGEKSEKPFRNPAYYTNRELSWLQFDNRILGEARDKSIPLFERLKFLSITASNLDEFFNQVETIRIRLSNSCESDFAKACYLKHILIQEIHALFHTNHL